MKYLCYIFVFCFTLALGAQDKKPVKKYNITDTALIRGFIDKRTAHGSGNNDSAMYYADMAIDAAQQIKNESLLALGFYLKGKLNFYTSNFSAAQFYQYKSLVLAQKHGEKDLESKAYNLGGAIFYSLGNYDEALKQYNNRLRISTVLKDTSSVLQAYFNIALLYNTKGGHGQAVEVNYKALEIAEKRKDTLNIMALYEGLGMAYYQLKDREKGTAFLNKAYQLAIVKKLEYEQSGILIDLGNVYQQAGAFYRSIYYYNKAIAITKKTGDKRRQSTAISNKAKSLLLLKKPKEALALNEDALKLNLEINYTKGICNDLATKAEALIELKRYKEAEECAIKSAEIARNIKATKEEHDCYTILNIIYDKTNDTKKAYEYFKRATALNDSIENMAEVKAIAELGFNYEKENALRKQRFIEEEARATVRRQKQIGNTIMAVGIIMLFLLLFIVRVYFQTRKANDEISRQNKIIEKTNTRILESIDYSKEIQQSILTPAKDVDKLLPDSFVLYKPKDIVSGDFYFIEPILRAKLKWIAVALADCTGHGVPGALMSLMGYNILKQSLAEDEVNNPGQALDYLNKELHLFLRQNQKEKHILDGMDIAFCAFEFDSKDMSFSGANNPLWIASKNKNLEGGTKEPITLISQNGENYLYEIKATKQPIGFSENPKQFTNHKLTLEKGDTVYLFTDGFADQFGGPKGKKFKYRQLSDLILSNCEKSMAEQKRVLEKAFEKWKGSLEQVDDVSIIGIRI